jgi:hypothetical protein
MDAWMYDEAFR